MIAVLGSSGQLGSAMASFLGDECRPVSRSELDLRDVGSIQAWIGDERPDLIINCAAYTAVDAAEDDKETARLVNTVAVGELARATERCQIRFVTFSTDYVFDGTSSKPYVESDPPNPLSVYGRTKLEGERLALDRNAASLIIRTSWLLSGTHSNFVSTMLRLIRKGPVNVVDDQRGHPTVVSDLAQATMQGVRRGATGVLHLTNEGTTSWFGLARETAEIAGLDPDRVLPIRSDQLSRPASRPRNSVLESERAPNLGLEALPHYRTSLRSVVESLLSLGY